MIDIEEALYTPTLQLLSGHFHETSGYRIWRPKGVDDWLLVLTLSGAGRFGYAAGDLIAEAGDWVLIRPGTLHDYAVAPGADSWELLWVHFQPRPDWLAWLDWPEIAPGLMHLHIADAAVAARFHEVHRLAHADLRRRDAFAMNALEALVLDCDRFNPLAAHTRYDARIRRAMDYLDLNLGHKIVLDDVAAAIGLSPSRLAHLFRAETGQTPQHYLETRRMQRAADLLLRTGFSIQQIAGAVGFESPFYFSHRFKAATGKRPSAFRAAAAG
jgi:AraC family transcriptional regulator of arabinose operon